MLSGILGQNDTFISNLNRIEARTTKVNQEVTSGVRVSQASDDPLAVSSILLYQGQIDHLAQTQNNLAIASSDASAADSAMQSASTILDSISSLGSQGMTLSAGPETRTTLGNQIQALQSELVSLANTSVRGNYIFGGDTPSVPPYSIDSTSDIGVSVNAGSTPISTRILTDGAGTSHSASLSAATIFDTRDNTGSNAVLTNAALGLSPALDSTAHPGIAQTFTFTVQGQPVPLAVTINGTPGGFSSQSGLLSSLQTAIDAALSGGSPALPSGTIAAGVDGNNQLQFQGSSVSFSVQASAADDTAHDAPAGITGRGNPAPDNIFAAVNFLSKALLNNDTNAIQTGIKALKTASTYLQTSGAFYGNVENWINDANTSASTQSNNLSSALSSLKDTDLASAATALTLDKTAFEAAIAAHGSLSNKTLFDYLG